jgi:hypothetical protein
MVLFQLACQWLLQEHLVRPGVTIVERLVATNRQRAQDETYRRLTALLTPRCAMASTLSSSRTPALDEHHCPGCNTKRPPSHRALPRRNGQAVLTARTQRADAWELTAVTPNRRKLLARIGRRATNQALQRTPPERRYPTLLAFLEQAVEEVTDEVVDLFDRAVTNSYARARRELDEFRRSPLLAESGRLPAETYGPFILDGAPRFPYGSRGSARGLSRAVQPVNPPTAVAALGGWFGTGCQPDARVQEPGFGGDAATMRQLPRR